MQVTSTGALADERGIRAEKAEAEVQEMAGRFNAQERVIETLQEDNRKCTR